MYKRQGWTLTTVTGKYPKAYKLFHAEISEGVTEISWSGGKLPDAWYDEFVFQGFVAGDLEAGKTIYFPVVQECEKGVHPGSRFRRRVNRRRIIPSPHRG